MGRKRSRKQSPLFYINQPNIDLPQPDMQKNFSFNNSEEMSEEQQQQENSSRTIEVNSEETGISEEVIHETESLDAPKKRNFKEYTLEEKIKHLKLVPASVAKVKYEFITIERSYKGYFIEMKDDILFIHSISPRKKSVSILKEDLVDIKRAGL
ncbi:CotO family spore coat protein [Mesobacillus jeotgali]|uniref:CotO family spore coat protein n=1 Tax=Mesobacillus jeotgali TaxID=129985 RepID=UPI001CFDCE1D|nr:CotO family spore coat protein [Mesobacillus jeotgali]